VREQVLFPFIQMPFPFAEHNRRERTERLRPKLSRSPPNGRNDDSHLTSSPTDDVPCEERKWYG
jgi:hypothetical protein